jgi:hypothetical protein
MGNYPGETSASYEVLRKEADSERGCSGYRKTFPHPTAPLLLGVAVEAGLWEVGALGNPGP